MKKIIGVLVTGVILAGVFTGCQKKSEAGASSDGKLKPVRIASTAQTGDLQENALIANRLGYIEEELNKVGYTAVYSGFAGAGPAVNEALASKEIDYAVYADFPAITAKSNGVDVKIIASINSENNYALLVTEKSGIKNVKDIVGKKIIVTKGTILYKYFIDLCEINGINPDSVTQVNALSYANTVLASGEADGLIITLGGAIMYQAMGLGRVIDDTTTKLDYASGHIFAGRTAYLKDNPDTAKAIVRALERSYEYAKAHPDEVYKLLETEHTPAALLGGAYGYNTSFDYFSPELSDKYLERAKKVYDFCSKNKLLGSEFNLKDLFDTSYADEVLGKK